MKWYKKEFTEGEISVGTHQQFENLLLGEIAGPDAPSHSIYLAAYNSTIEANGTFTGYFSPDVVSHFPHLRTSYDLKVCEKPDASSVRTWVGIEPVASRLLQREESNLDPVIE